MKRLHHVAVCVRDLDAALRVWRDGLGLEPTGIEDLPDRGVRVAMLTVGDVRIELVQPTVGDSEVSAFLARRGEGVHHIALEVDALQPALRLATGSGMTPIVRGGGRGADGSRVAFLHPKSANGVLVELVEAGPALDDGPPDT